MNRAPCLLGESRLSKASIAERKGHPVGDKGMSSSRRGEEAGQDRRAGCIAYRLLRVAALAEFMDTLDVVDCLDRGIGSLKQRGRGTTAGELLVGMAQSQLLGGDSLVALDRHRGDVSSAELSAVPGIPSTTAGSLACQFGESHLARGLRPRLWSCSTGPTGFRPECDIC
jgi:hypothetical protein